MSLSPVSTSAKVEPKVLSGNLENFTKENMGAFLGKGGDKLKKFVTVKSAIMVKDAYKKDFEEDDTSKTNPDELGSVLIKVKIEGENEYQVSIHNEKENLDKYLDIVMKNLFTHAKNCSKKRVVENKYRNKIAFVAELNHEGLIGKFVGSGGKKIKMLIPSIGLALIISSCQSSFLTSMDDKGTTSTLNVLSNNKGEDAAHLAAINEVLDASVDSVPTISAMGYAVVSSQPGRSANQKRLMAIRSARMAAMRDLAEQIHGLKVEGNTTVIDLMVQNDTFRGIVSGTIRGARTVRINPTGSDTYEVLLEIDKDTLSYLLRQARTVA